MENAKSTDLPDGDAKAASAPTLVSLEKQFRECYLREVRDPLNWNTMLQTIAMNMNRIIVAGKSDKTAQDIAIHIAVTAPK